MNKKNRDKIISNYDFLRLLTSTIITEKENPIIENHQLEKDLYKFYDRSEYHHLFQDINKKIDLSGNNNYVDLDVSFQTAYTYGIMTQVHDSYNKNKSIITLSDEEAKSIQSEFSEENNESVRNLCEELHNKVSKQNKVFIKK